MRKRFRDGSRTVPVVRGRTVPAFLVAVCIGLSACATTGPGATREEVAEAKRTLEAKRLRHVLQAEARLLRIGTRILQNLPPENRDREHPFLGILLHENDETARRAFSLPSEKGLVVGGLLTREAAVVSQLEVGDLVKSIGGTPVTRAKEAAKIPSESKPGMKLKIEAKRRGVPFETEIPVEALGRKISFTLNDRKKEVNAYANLFGIQFTLPMMSFLTEDDQLAVIVGHEVAHIVRGHIKKSIGTSTAAGFLGGLVAIPLNMVVPGAGSVVSFLVTSSIQSRFSQEYEKEADYLGLQLTHRAGYDIRAGSEVWERFAIELPKRMSWGFLNTHPSTPERFVRTEKVIAEVTSEKSG